MENPDITFGPIAAEYDNIADRTASKMMGEHLEAAFSLLKQVHPEARGFQALVLDSPDGSETRVAIRLLESAH